MNSGRPYEPSSSSGFWIQLFVGDHCESYQLHRNAQLRVGSSPDSDIRIEHPSVAPLHAVLHIGQQVEVEDLGSVTGTLVRNERLRAGQKVVLSALDSLAFGDIVVELQRRSTTVMRQILASGHFHSRLEEECARALRKSSPFTLMWVIASPSAPTTQVEALLAKCLRTVDVVGHFGANEYQVLLTDTDAAGSNIVRQRLEQWLGEAIGPGSRLGMAHFRTHGTSAVELSQQARSLALEPTKVRQLPGSTHAAGFRKLRPLVERVAASDINVLILGETGSGKEVMAETIHELSKQAKAQLLKLNCAALPESLLESELFGYERGAFTGANKAKAGLLESCNGGTVFLDEIGELPLNIQVKLLRVLESRQVIPLGSLTSRAINARFLAATNRDLSAAVKAGTFREDLYYRLDGITLFVPPLRERLDEIEPLALQFLAEATLGKEPVILSDEALAFLKSYPWPGNIRELKNVVQRAVLLCEGNVIEREHLLPERLGATFVVWERSADNGLSAPKPMSATVPPPSSAPRLLVPPRASPPAHVVAAPADVHPLKQQFEILERERIVEALRETGGNQSEAARRLGMPRRTLVSKLDKYGVVRPRKSRSAL